MSAITITIDIAPVQSMLDELAQKTGDLSPIMSTIGEIVVRQVDDAFKDQRSPGGVPWKRSQRAIADGGQTLIDRGVLRNSITRKVAGQSVTVGTNVEYSAIHQFGGVIRPKKKKALAFGGIVRRQVTMPARPFLPDQQTLDWEEIRHAIWRHLQ